MKQIVSTQGVPVPLGMLALILNKTVVTMVRDGAPLGAFSVDLSITQNDETMSIAISDTPLTDAVLTTFRYLHPYYDLFDAPREPVRTSGTVMTYRGRRLPPEIIVRSPWGSVQHTWFKERDESCRDFEDYEPPRKFDMHFDTPQGPWALVGCFVRAVVRDHGEAVAVMSADMLDPKAKAPTFR
jgi:hypothetical protein